MPTHHDKPQAYRLSLTLSKIGPHGRQAAPRRQSLRAQPERYFYRKAI